MMLHTDRLLVRNFRRDDWAALHELIFQYQSSEMAAYDHLWPTSVEEMRQVAEWFAGGDSHLAVCLKETGRLIGLVTLNLEDAEGRSEYSLGYIFNADYHGKGYATEACRAILDDAFARLGADRVIAGTAEANHASRRLLARLGFVKIGEDMVSFRNAPDGAPIEFLGYSFQLTRAHRHPGAAALAS